MIIYITVIKTKGTKAKYLPDCKNITSDSSILESWRNNSLPVIKI